MAFPTNPTNGQIYSKYKYNSAKGSWEFAGDIVDSGSNANGRYVKYSDGTMEQWGRTTHPASAGNITASFPISFVGSLPAITLSAENGSGASDIIAFLAAPNFTSLTSMTQYVRGAGWTSMTNYVNWTAIGRWK